MDAQMDPNIEIYPMPSFPLLNVTDLAAAARWYQEALGFQHIFTMPGPGGAPGLVHLRWVKYADLLLTSRPAADGPRGVGVTLTYSAYLAERTVDDIAAQAAAAGATIAAPPTDMPWNARECTIQDPDGYRLTFSQPINMQRKFSDVLDAVRQAEG